MQDKLAISAILGGQMDYYEEIQKSNNKTTAIAMALGLSGKIDSIQGFLDKMPDSVKYDYLCSLFIGSFQGQHTLCLVFLERQIRAQNYAQDNPDQIIDHLKMVGAASAGNIAEYKAALTAIIPLIPAYKQRAAKAAAKSGYKAVLQEIDAIMDKYMLRAAVKNGMMDSLASLIDHPSLENEAIDSIFQIMYDWTDSLFWSQESAKHTLARIRAPKVRQFLLPLVEHKFGLPVMQSTENYADRINEIRNGYPLSYNQAVCLFGEEDSSKVVAWIKISHEQPALQRAFGEKVTLPVEIMCNVTRFFHPTMPLTNRETYQMHEILGSSRSLRV